MKRFVMLFTTLMALSVMGISVSAKTTSTKGPMVGQLKYTKTKMNAKFNNNYGSFKLYNHVPNSNYKKIKTISWKKIRN